MQYSDEVSNYIDSAPERFIVILKEIREIIHQTINNTNEEIKWGFAVFGNPKDFTYLRYNKNHVTFGFYHFDKISEQPGRLEGTGSTMRHIKLRKREDIDKELFSKWLKEIVVE